MYHCYIYYLQHTIGVDGQSQRTIVNVKFVVFCTQWSVDNGRLTMGMKTIIIVVDCSCVLSWYYIMFIGRTIDVIVNIAMFPRYR